MRVQFLLRQDPSYRSDSFREGLERCGHKIVSGDGDALVIWNRYGSHHAAAQRYEASGRPVLVAENSPVSREWRGSHWYTICRGWHNGAGQWAAGAPRWSTWNIPLSPWREKGERIMILAQRGIGAAPVAEPKGWADLTALQLSKRTKRLIEIRRHPGEQRRNDPIDWTGVHAAVTWGSGAGIKAILAGIPVFHGMERWIGAAAARPLSHDLEAPFLGDRLPMLERLSWAIWSVEEIRSGEPFRRLLD